MRDCLSICALAAALTFARALPVAGQTSAPGDPPKEINGRPFREYANSQEYFDQLAEETLSYEARLGPCGAPTKVDRLQAGRPQIPSTFPKLGTPPQWMEILKVSGCDKPVERAVLVLYANKKLVILPLINGKALSRLDVILQRDVITTLVTTERILATRLGCRPDAPVRILDTRTLSNTVTEGGLAWEEEWRLANCKGEKRVKVSYRSRMGGGTDFTIEQINE